MSNVYPLNQQSYKQTGVGTTDPNAGAQPTGVVVTTQDPNAPQYDTASNTTQVALPDGSVSITVGEIKEQKESEDFGDNLAEYLTESELSTIAEKLLLGIESDKQSRAGWIENMTAGISLLGLEANKSAKGAATSSATPQEGVSTVDHPLLLEAVLRFQANARGELLPSDGPVKVRNDGEGNALADLLAEALEKDMNHYLTKTAKEYYPDTDRMLLLLGFSGISFKKGYHDPIKRRPVIASIDSEDLIVSNAATDIEGAGRVTHRIMMKPSTLRRMQLLGAYRDITLSPMPLTVSKDPLDSKIDQIQGIAPPTYSENDDQDRELYECYCEIEVPGFEHKMDGEETGLPLPYKVTIDREARRVLEIRRNWHEDDEFCLPRNRIIAYTFIPGLGFYGIGLLNVLGNATKAVTAAWRLMIDAGMFANFPGFLYVKSLAKQMTNQFRIAPGSGMPIDTVGGDIRASVMPLPYKDPSAVFIQLTENIAAAARNVGGIAEMSVGEGKQDAPVGTTLALIEQATKMMSAVHKRLHQAQSQEFDMLKSLLMEDPEALWRHNKKSKVLKLLTQQAGQQPIVDAIDAAEERHRQLFLAALSDCELVPAADPNTSSQTERYLKIVAAKQIQASNQNIDQDKIDAKALRTLGWDDAESYFKPPVQNAEPPPEAVMAAATMVTAQARMQDAQTKAKEADIKAAQVGGKVMTDQQAQQSKDRIAGLNLMKEVMIHQNTMARDDKKLKHDHHHRSQDRAQGVALAQLGNQAAQQQQQHEAQQAGLDRQHSAGIAQMQQAYEAQQAGQERQHNAGLALAQHLADYHNAGLDQNHEQRMSELGHQQKLEQIAATPKPSKVAKAKKPKKAAKKKGLI